MKNLLIFFVSAGMLLFSSCNSLVPEENFEEDVVLKGGKMVKIFKADLTGEEEVPPVLTTAGGQAVFRLSKDETELHFTLVVTAIENVRMAHIHLAPAGINGAVVAWLYPEAPPAIEIDGVTNGLLARGVIRADNLVGPLAGETVKSLINELEAGNAYVNVHTTANPGGEIRGQISLTN